MMTVKRILLYYTKEDLQGYAKNLKLKRYSSLKKEALAECIAQYILMPQIMKKRMSVLRDQDIALLEAATDGRYLVTKAQEDSAFRLDVLDYALYTELEELIIPKEVWEVYQEINTPEFQQKRIQVNWLLQCLNWCNKLYGITPFDLLHKIYISRSKFQVSQDELLRLYYYIPEDQMDCELLDMTIISKAIKESGQMDRILTIQKGKSYYEPTWKQVRELEEYRYLKSQQEYEKMYTICTKIIGLSHIEAQDECEDIWKRFSKGYDIQEIMQMVGKRIHFPSEASVHEFLQALQNAGNATRMMVHRGNTPNEIQQEYRRTNPRQKPVIVPGSQRAANILGELSPQLQRMGIGLDLESNAKKVGEDKI